MKYPKPKANKRKVSWNISEKTLTILSFYSKFSNYSEDEVVDLFMENLLTDELFIDFINKQRYRKKLDSILQSCELVNVIGGNQDDETEEINSKT